MPTLGSSCPFVNPRTQVHFAIDNGGEDCIYGLGFYSFLCAVFLFMYSVIIFLNVHVFIQVMNLWGNFRLENGALGFSITEVLA
jgi:hypothetical protein